MSYSVRRVDPLTIAEALKRLFTSNERPEYPDWFDRAYPVAVGEGAASWVTLDPDGHVVAHVAGFTAHMSIAGQEVRGGLLCNLMADKEHRTFFPVVGAIKRAVKDMREGGAEFIYTNPINPGSVATMKAAGLAVIGQQNRYLLPLGHGNPLVSAAVGLNVLLRRLRRPGITARPCSLDDAVRWTVDERCEVSSVTAARRATVYGMRWPDFREGSFIGVAFYEGHTQVGAAVVSLERRPEGHWLVTLRSRTLPRVAPCVSALGALLRSDGIERLNTFALMGTDFAKALERGGFVQRNEPWTIVAAGYTDLGRQVVAGLGASDLEKIDVD